MYYKNSFNVAIEFHHHHNLLISRPLPPPSRPANIMTTAIDSSHNTLCHQHHRQLTMPCSINRIFLFFIFIDQLTTFLAVHTRAEGISPMGLTQSTHVLLTRILPYQTTPSHTTLDTLWFDSVKPFLPWISDIQTWPPLGILVEYAQELSFHASKYKSQLVSIFTNILNFFNTISLVYAKILWRLTQINCF